MPPPSSSPPSAVTLTTGGATGGGEGGNGGDGLLTFSLGGGSGGDTSPLALTVDAADSALGFCMMERITSFFNLNSSKSSSSASFDLEALFSVPGLGPLGSLALSRLLVTPGEVDLDLRLRPLPPGGDFDSLRCWDLCLGDRDRLEDPVWRSLDLERLLLW